MLPLRVLYSLGEEAEWRSNLHQVFSFYRRGQKNSIGKNSDINMHFRIKNKEKAKTKNQVEPDKAVPQEKWSTQEGPASKGKHLTFQTTR